MTAIIQRVFSGLSPKTDSELLGPVDAQVARNVRLDTGTLKPSKLAASIATITKVNPKTIYRFGQYETSEAQFWFSFANDVNLVKSAISGDTSERTYYTGDGFPKVTNSTLALTGGTDYPIAFLRMGVPRPSGQMVVSAPTNSDPTPPPSEVRVYVVVFVNSFGEQGAPNLASAPVVVYGDDTASLTGIPVPPTGNYDIPTKRIFRSATGSVDAVFRFAGEIPAAQTTFSDTVATEDLGEVLSTDDHDPPPDTLQGLCLGPNGVYAGFSGIDVYFSPPFKAYAWPERYVLTMDSPVVGIAPMRQGFFVATQANPYLILGPDAESFNQVAYQEPWACVSKRSIVSMMGGVLYASADGIVMATEGGLVNMTDRLLTRDQWQAYKPSSMHCHQINGKYVVFYDTGTVQKSLVFDFSNKQALFTDGDEWYSGAYSDRFRDALFVVNSTAIQKMDSAGLQTYIYRSKKNRVPKPTNFGHAQVIARAYPVTMRVYADGVLKHTETVADANTFRLPGGFLAAVWEFELEGTAEVLFAGIAHSTRELQEA